MLEPPSVQSVEHLFKQITLAIWKVSMHLRLVGAHLVTYIYIFIVFLLVTLKFCLLPDDVLPETAKSARIFRYEKQKKVGVLARYLLPR